VSVDSLGAEAYRRSWLPTISADGTRVLFLSDADNLVNEDYNGAADAFLRDLVNGTTERVDLPDGITGNAEAVSGCGWCDLSADGWTVAFESWSDDLVQGDTNGANDVFVRDLSSGSTSRVSVSTYNYEGDGSSSVRPRCLSSDGSRVVFASAMDGGPSRIAQRAALIALEPDRADQETTALRTVFAKKRNLMLARLKKLGVRFPKEPLGTFYCFGSLEKMKPPFDDAMHFFREALQRKVLTVPGEFFDVNPGKRRRAPSPYRQWMRFSFGPPQGNMELGLRRLEEMVRRG